MSFMDDQGGKDHSSTNEKLHTYTAESEEQQNGQQTTEKTTKKATKAVTSESSGGGSKGGLLTRLRRTLLGDESVGSKAKRGFLQGKAEAAAGGGGGALGAVAKFVAKAGAPKVLAGIMLGSGIGIFSILGIFTTYKNDGVVKNDPPMTCEQGVIELPSGSGGDEQDIQENVNIMYDIFVNQFGYSENALVGMLSCMMVESNINPDRLESDYILTSQKEAFDSVAGPDTAPGSDTTLDAFFTYADAFRSGGGYNGNDGGYILSEGPNAGKMTCGIGLIQWTKGRAENLINGLDKVSMDVSVMDIHYQCAFLLAELKTIDSYAKCSPDGGEFLSIGDDIAATEMFFTTVVSGGSTKDLDKRTANVPACRDYVNNAAANSEFTQDTVTMAEILADDGFSSAVSKSNKIQLCVNNTYISTADIANAAVSISFLERGEYEDVNGAYGMYRRAARSPVMVNDWNFIEGKDTVPNDRMTGVIKKGTYGSTRGVPADDQRHSSVFYTNEGAPGKLDLIACTEYYYFAHLIAFPKETGLSGAGYFSSCDRGTATAVRIAGADDKFPAGNPLYQLTHAVGAAKAGAQHDPDRRGPQGNGFLWQFSGFMRGCDYYPASASSSISAGTVMISWNERAANGLLGESGAGAATTGGVGEEGGVVGDDSYDPSTEVTDPEFDENDAMAIANLRWPRSVTNTTRHIITFVGEGTVQSFWGMDWLYQQWNLFDDTDRLIRGDLTVKLPDLMLKGLSYKSSTAKKASDQKQTFWQQEMKGAKNQEDRQTDEATTREMSFNAKTGLPTFKAWEQIFTRLVHDSDDDATTSGASGDDLYIEYELDKDNYLDEATDPDQIEQFQGQKTTSDKSWLEDWNSVGAGDVKSGGNGDYEKVEQSELPYIDDNTERDWTVYDDGVGGLNPYWRYELITDIEYRTNQLLRFGMASFMCTLPSEEDADVFQTGNEGNDAGHIIGNIYRRYSRIPDDIDVSGRFYYYNNVISNDMLQDLTQLWTHERNGNKANYKARNYGPMYLFSKAGEGMGMYDAVMSSQNSNWKDRRYGLAASDIESIMNGLGGLSMGAGGDAISEAMGKIINVPMHEMSDAQKALYDRTKPSNEEANTDGRNAHESSHLYSEGFYENDVYGVNPFLALDTALGGDYAQFNIDDDDWSQSSGKAGSVRRDLSLGKDLKDDVDGNYDLVDERLAWIDRHYVRGYNGNINMLAYQIAGLNPSVGHIVTNSEYADELKGSDTLNAGETTGTGDKGVHDESDNLYGSWGNVRYTDFVYGETKDDNEKMAKRLFGKDNRQGDSEVVRDDYNRREYIVIPYYHTHSQECNHDTGELEDLTKISDEKHYAEKDVFKCEWWGDDPHTDDPDVGIIDTQIWLNTNFDGDSDNGDTISFESNLANRGKYDLEQLLATGNVRYFTNNGNEIIPEDEQPRIHVTCDGWTQQGECYGGGGCGSCDDPLTLTVEECECGGDDYCSEWVCHACGETYKCYEQCTHTCAECLAEGLCHDHTECDSELSRDPSIPNVKCEERDKDYEKSSSDRQTDHHNDHGMTGGGTPGEHYTGIDFSGETDDCHDQYGCNVLEFLYHNPGESRKNGEVVDQLYMVIPVVENPKEDFDIDKWMEGGQVVPDKANLLQQVYFNQNSGFVDFNWNNMTNDIDGALTRPNTSGGYMSPIHHLGSVVAEHYTDAYWGMDRTGTSGDPVKMPIGNGGSQSSTQPKGGKTLFGIFTIEGDQIRADGAAGENTETVSDTAYNSKVSDFQLLEAIRNRVGYGKQTTYPIDGDSVSVRQRSSGVSHGSGLAQVKFDSSAHGEPGVRTDYGYGEVAVTGTQHALDPTPAAGGYGLNDVCGPDGKKGNKKSLFGNSLLREIIGDQHVAHVRFGTQDPAGLTLDNADNGRDFVYYMNHEKWGEHLDGHGYDKKTSPDYYAPDYYQTSGNTCPGCGLLTMPEDFSTATAANWLGHPQNPDVGGEFVDLDEDKLYLDPYNNIPTDKMYFDELKKKCTDDPVNEAGQPNKPNKEMVPSGPDTDTQVSNAPNGSVADDATNGSDTGNGDYRLWVTHASRGTRGMMTQYLNFKGFFHDAFDNDATSSSKNFCYMMFTNIKRSDTAETTENGGYKGSANADNDIDTKEDFVYANPPSDAVDMNPKRVWGTGSVEIKNDAGDVIGYKPKNFSDTYGQGANSHWKSLIDIYNAAMSETRHFD